MIKYIPIDKYVALYPGLTFYNRGSLIFLTYKNALELREELVLYGRRAFNIGFLNGHQDISTWSESDLIDGGAIAIEE